MEKKEHIVEITYSESGDSEVITLKTDDLAWSMNQYQRNRLPLTWELLDIKEPEVVLPIEEDECCGEGCCKHNPELDHATLDDLDMIHKAIVNRESDKS